MKPTARALLVLMLLSGASAAQAPPPSGSAPSATPPSPTEPVSACIEKLPGGKARPPMSEAFPTRGLSGHALELVLTLPHGPAETVLPTGFRFQSAAPEAKLLKQAG